MEGLMIGGRNNVMAALESGRSLNKILVGDYVRGNLEQLISLARSHNCPVQFVPRQRLDQVAGEVKHQGVVAFAPPVRYWDIDEVLASTDISANPILLMLAGVEDPHNLGSLLRTSACAGVSAVIIPSRRSAQLTDAAVRVSMGGSEEVPVCRVTNLVNTIEKLQQAGFWAAAADPKGKEVYDGVHWNFPLVMVLGGEGQGVPRLLLEKCDYRVIIPIQGRVSSLNVSVAGAVLLFEVLRQRRNNSD